MLTKVASLTQQIAYCNSGKLFPGGGSGSAHSSHKNHYCWNHGRRCEHNSWNFNESVEGYQKQEKQSSTMNGLMLKNPWGMKVINGVKFNTTSFLKSNTVVSENYY